MKTKIYRIRPSKEVLETSAGTRRRSFQVEGELFTLEFGKEPTYLELAELPRELEQDPHLLVKEVTQDEMKAAGGTVTRLKPERVQGAAPPQEEPRPAATSVAPPAQPTSPPAADKPAAEKPAPLPPAGPPKPRTER